MWSCVGKTCAVGADSWVLDVQPLVGGGGGVVCVNSGSGDRQISLHDGSSLACVWRCAPHSSSSVCSDVQSVHSSLLVSCARDGTVALLDPRLRSAAALLRCPRPCSAVAALSGSGSGALLVAAACGSDVALLDTRTLRLLAALDGGHAQDEEIAALRCCPANVNNNNNNNSNNNNNNSVLLASGGTDGLVALWRLDLSSSPSSWTADDCLEEVLNEEAAVSRLDWRSSSDASSSSSLLFVSSLQQSSLWLDGFRQWALPTASAYLPLGPALPGRCAFAHRDGAVALLPPPGAPDQTQLWLLGGHAGAACRGLACLSPDLLVSGGEDGQLCAWRPGGSANFVGEEEDSRPPRSVGSFGFAGAKDRFKFG